MICSICLEESDNKIITLDCGHIFHEKCIKLLHNFICPLCRKDIDVKKIFNLENEHICNQNYLTHQNLGYCPHIENGLCRFCSGRPINIILKLNKIK